MPTLFLKRTKIWRRENGKFIDFSDLTPLRFNDAPARNAFEYLQMIYIENGEMGSNSDAPVWSLIYIFATHSVVLCLLLFTQSSLKVENC